MSIKKSIYNSIVVSTIISLLMFFTATPYVFAAAVPFDHAQNASATGTMSFAAGASATVAVAYVRTDSSTCSVTYAGVSMLNPITALSLNGDENYFGFYLAGISGGTQNVVLSCSGGGNSNWQFFVATYTGGPYATWPDSVASGAKANGTGSTLNIVLNTVASNVIGTSQAANGGVAFAATAMTIRTSTSVANSMEDSTNTFSPGANNMVWTNSGGNTTNIQGLAIGIANATSSPVTATSIIGLVRAFFDF